MSFLFLQPGFTQDIFGVSQHFMGGVAFAPDGDPWVDDCVGSGGHLHRYDSQSTPPPVNGTPLHTESIHNSNAGCGLTNHPNGSMYSNLVSGVVRLNANVGAATGGPFGPSGNALGIAVQISTGNVIYVGSNGTLFFVNENLTSFGTFSTVTTGNFVDGIAFDPTGDFLFLSNRSPTFRLTVLDGTTGALIQHIPMASEPDGISFHADTPKFVVTNNTNGTMTRFDFPADDYTQVPVQSVFASGGFRGDLSQVGSDGCVYLTQAGTRYNNGVVTGQNSLVRICGGFAPPIARGADKEVTDVVLDDASGYPNAEGRELQQVSRDPSTRTTTYRMSVPLLTNPFISVVSLEQNNGPQDTESAITFLASIDDGHAPGHVGGAFIPDAGSPRGQSPDLLTCHSRFNPENPLEQTLVPCPHREKVPGDGIRETAESDLHFEMTQEAGTRERILRFFKLHCLVVGQHTITFYNKVEVLTPIVDPDLENNWWRAILVIDCVIQSTPGKVTGGGYIEAPPDGGGGGGGLPGLAEMTIVDGVAAGVGGKANFGFVINLEPDEMVPTGNLLYYDHAADVRIKSTSYDGLLIVCPHATFTGTAQVNGVEKKYQVDVDDIDEPGSSPGVGPDTFTIRVLDGSYMATGPLVGGNIQVHKPPECG
jgi:hypothetical protein